MNQVTSARLSKKYEQYALFMSSATYCRPSYSNNHLVLKYRNFEQGIHFIEAQSRNYETHFKMKWDHHRGMPYRAIHYSPPQPSRQGPSKILNNNFYNKRRNTQYTSRHGTGSTRSY